MPKVHPKMRTINGKEFVEDLRSGMTDLEMIQKYGLSLQGFDRVLEYLVDAGLIARGELLERQHLSDCQILRAFVESREDTEIVRSHPSMLPRTRVIAVPRMRQR
ncbi:MAG: hypothetical protein ACLP5H_31980 [Desulfomonilaceae bacterium]